MVARQYDKKAWTWVSFARPEKHRPWWDDLEGNTPEEYIRNPQLIEHSVVAKIFYNGKVVYWRVSEDDEVWKGDCLSAEEPLW
jgi:hypothetical protein